MISKINLYNKDKITYPQMMEIYQGWQAYAKWASTYKLRRDVIKYIYKIKKSKPIDSINQYLH